MKWKFSKIDGIVTWDGKETEIEFDVYGRVSIISGPELPSSVIEDLEQNEAEARNEQAQGDAWSGGFAENH